MKTKPTAPRKMWTPPKDINDGNINPLLFSRGDFNDQTIVGNVIREVAEHQQDLAPASDDPHAAAIFNLHRKRQGLE